LLEAQRLAYEQSNTLKDEDLKTIVELKYEASSDEEFRSTYSSQ
jgi:hypothetical protein